MYELPPTRAKRESDWRRLAWWGAFAALIGAGILRRILE